MPSPPRTPAEHYTAATTLLAAVEETPDSAAFLAIAHALLCAAPRRARKRAPGSAWPPRHLAGSELLRLIRESSDNTGPHQHRESDRPPLSAGNTPVRLRGNQRSGTGAEPTHDGFS
jgi:hypothetical protein